MKKNFLKKIKLILEKIKNKIKFKKNIKNKNNKKINKIKKKIKILKEFYINIKIYKKNIKNSKSLLIDKDLNLLAKEDIKINKYKLKNLKIKLIKFLKPKKNIQSLYLEIQIGTGGEESSMFVLDLSKMYIKYSEKKKWLVKILSFNKSNLGGYKEIIILIKGNNSYNKLKFESGVHRVQRKPITENQDRIHTSTCKIAVIPKIKLKKIVLKKNDIRIDTFKSSGAGGQHVNKTNSAVRIKHIPSGLIVECQNERSQHKNKYQAMKLLNYKISIKELEKNKKNHDIKKKNLLGLGQRSEKIRTYNYIKNRITDHRIKKTLYKLNLILNGNLDELLNYFKNYVNK